MEASANGEAFSLPSGALKTRCRRRLSRVKASTSAKATGRCTTARAASPISLAKKAFAPLVRPSDQRLGLNALDLTVAGRIEHYSDFGWTANPKVGLRYKPAWQPMALRCRRHGGRPSRRPSSIQKVQPATVFYYSAADLGSASVTGTALLAYGGNPDLKPGTIGQLDREGIDWSPPEIRSLSVSLTYFNIDYTHRIIQPVNNA